MLESYLALPQKEQALKIRITHLIDNQLLNHVDNNSAPIYDRHIWLTKNHIKNLRK
jgi:hypothetical protein